MNRQLRTTATGIAVFIGAALCLLGGCAADPPVPQPRLPGENHSEGPTLGNADAATTARMGLAAMFSWQPRTDTSPGAALARALPWLTGELATAAANTTPTPGQRSLPEWVGWRDSGDVVTALVETEQPRIVGAEALVAAMVTQLVLHPDGSVTRYQHLHVTATIVGTAAEWQMSSYRVNPGT